MFSSQQDSQIPLEMQCWNKKELFLLFLIKKKKREKSIQDEDYIKSEGRQMKFKTERAAVVILLHAMTIFNAVRQLIKMYHCSLMYI